MLANNVIFISLPKIATTSCAKWDTCVTDTPVRRTGSALNYLQAITQVSGQPDRGRVPNCCRSTCLDYVTIQSPAYAASQENASTDSRPNYRVWPPPSSPPARPVWHRRSKMHKSLQVHPCLNSTTLCCAKLISPPEGWRHAVRLVYSEVDWSNCCSDNVTYSVWLQKKMRWEPGSGKARSGESAQLTPSKIWSWGQKLHNVVS